MMLKLVFIFMFTIVSSDEGEDLTENHNYHRLGPYANNESVGIKQPLRFLHGVKELVGGDTGIIPTRLVFVFSRI